MRLPLPVMKLIPSPKSLLTGLVAIVLGVCTTFADDQVYTKVDEPPVPLKTPPPRYPDSLKRDGISGLVAVVVVIDEKGEVVSTEISKASHDDFKQPSIDAVKKWKFKPAKVAGGAVKVKVTLPLRFSAAD
jgi:periplasmic protein TonB